MKEEDRTPTTVKWITLKEAARLLNCSVKTIRRRVESGKMKSIVEYHGQKAIRLVAESDVMDEVTSLPYPPLKRGGELSAFNLFGDLPVRLENLAEETRTMLDNKVDSVYQRARIFFLISLGLVVILLVSLSLTYINRENRLLKESIRETKKDISRAAERNRLDAALRQREAEKKSEASRKLAEASLLEAEETNARLESLWKYTAQLQKEIAELRLELQGETETEEAKGEGGPKKEKEKDAPDEGGGFLGIF